MVCAKIFNNFSQLLRRLIFVVLAQSWIHEAIFKIKIVVTIMVVTVMVLTIVTALVLVIPVVIVFTSSASDERRVHLPTNIVRSSESVNDVMEIRQLESAFFRASSFIPPIPSIIDMFIKLVQLLVWSQILLFRRGHNNKNVK